MFQGPSHLIFSPRVLIDLVPSTGKLKSAFFYPIKKITRHVPELVGTDASGVLVPGMFLTS